MYGKLCVCDRERESEKHQFKLKVYGGGVSL